MSAARRWMRAAVMPVLGCAAALALAPGLATSAGTSFPGAVRQRPSPPPVSSPGPAPSRPAATAPPTEPGGGRFDHSARETERVRPPAAPTGLTLTSDWRVCAEHAGPYGARLCERLRGAGGYALVWDYDGAEASGFRVYRLLHGRPEAAGEAGPGTTSLVLEPSDLNACWAVSSLADSRESALSDRYCPDPGLVQGDGAGEPAAEPPAPPPAPWPDARQPRSRPGPDLGDSGSPPPERPPYAASGAGEVNGAFPPPSAPSPRRPATPAKLPTPSGRDCGTLPRDLYLDEYMRTGGPNGPMGCPLDGSPRPIPTDAEGGVWYFENGSIAISPAVWPHGVAAAFQQGNSITVDWAVDFGVAEPAQYSYDKFVVAWTDPQLGRQQDDAFAKLDAPRDTHLRSQGTYSIGICRGQPEGPDCSYGTGISGVDGTVSVQLEGCDNPTHDVLKPTPFNSRCLQGWMPTLQVTYHADLSQLPHSDQTAWINFGLTGAREPTSVEDAKAQFNARAGAAILTAACTMLPYTSYGHGEGYRVGIFAKLLYSEYFDSDYCPGRTVANQPEAIASLAAQKLWGDEVAGSTFEDIELPAPGPLADACGPHNTPCPPFRKGEYDVTMVTYAALLSRYGAILPPAVYRHVLDDLTLKRGRFDENDLHVTVLGMTGNETENHLLNIMTSQYLVNQLLYKETRYDEYNNATNGMNLRLATFLQNLLKHDFLEYNARPYQDYSLTALQYLYSFAADQNDAPAGTPSSHDVKLAARMVLDYVSAKAAVSSDDARRAGPYRRRRDKFGERDLLGPDADPQGPRLMQLAGVGLDQLTDPAQLGITNYGWQMVNAAFSAYRIPDLILDELVNREDLAVLERFHHDGDEIYWRSASYMLSAGGRRTPSLYHHEASGVVKTALDAAVAAQIATVGLVSPSVPHLDDVVGDALYKAEEDSAGVAMPTALIPAGPTRRLDDLLRFDGADGKDSTNLCVAAGFACGAKLSIPRVPAACRVEGPGPTPGSAWTFLDLAGGCSRARPYGYYVAIWKSGDDGFFEVYDRIVPAGASDRPASQVEGLPDDRPPAYVGEDPYRLLHPSPAPDIRDHGGGVAMPITGAPCELQGPAPPGSLSFDAFMKEVLCHNGRTPFSVSADNVGPTSYVMAGGERVAFRIGAPAGSPQESRILGPQPGGLVSGPFLSSDGSGRILIDNPRVAQTLILDDTDPTVPVRTLRGSVTATRPTDGAVGLDRGDQPDSDRPGGGTRRRPSGE